MSDPRDAFLEKFRASLRARVQKLRDMLEILKQVPDSADASAQVLGELHTLKGETRLLGLVQHSELAHTLETVLSRVDASTIASAEGALEVMARALMDQVSREEAESAIEAALRRFGAGAKRSGAPAMIEPAVPERDNPASQDAIPAAIGGSERWVQVDARLIDDLCDMMAAISGDFGRIAAQVNHLVSLARDSGGSGSRQGSLLIEECTRFRVALDNSTVRTWALRMVPVQPLLRELSTHAQQLAAAAGKSVHVTVDAPGVQIERDALDKVWEAMIHLVRNAVDHGIERAEERGTKGATGNMTISARTVGTSVALSISDDGRGIDVDRVRSAAIARQLLDARRAEAMSEDEIVQLVFEHGFSTRDQVSSISGRGVGLDVVKARAESLGGRVEVSSKRGLGTRFTITLPFTLTKERMILFELAGGLYGLPTLMVQEVIGWRDLPKAAANVDATVRVEGEPVPLRSLAELLGREPEPCSAALVVSLQEQQYGLLIGRVVGERELIRRPAEPLLARTTAIGGSAMMDDGRSVLVLDLARVGRHIRRTNGNNSSTPQQLAKNSIPRILLVDDSPILRDMVSEILASAGLQIVTAADGEEALARIAESEPDLVVSDIEMPKMDGFALLEQIRKRSQRLPVVMLTTRASVQDRQRATTLGANAYVLKEDFRSDVLLDVVQRFLPLHR